MPWSLVNSECSICEVLHTLSTALSHERLSYSPNQFHLSADLVVINSTHFHHYELTNEESPSSRCNSLPIYSMRMDDGQLLLQHRSTMASKCMFKNARLRTTTASLCSQAVALQVDIETRSTTLSRCISQSYWSWHPSASPTHLLLAFKCIIEFTWSWPAGPSVSSLGLGLQVRGQACLFVAWN